MRQRSNHHRHLIVVVVVLVLLNAASYVKVEATPDTESWPDRSTYNGVKPEPVPSTTFCMNPVTTSPAGASQLLFAEFHRPEAGDLSSCGEHQNPFHQRRAKRFCFGSNRAAGS
jgi:hypothetical protein